VLDDPNRHSEKSMKNLTNQQNNYTFLPDKTSSLGKQIKLSVVVSIFFRQKIEK